MKATILVTALTLLFAGTVHAQDKRADRMKDFQKRFEAADANGDGKLTKDEAKGRMPVVYKNFDAIDTQKAGFVTPADIATWARERQAAK